MGSGTTETAAACKTTRNVRETVKNKTWGQASQVDKVTGTSRFHGAVRRQVRLGLRQGGEGEKDLQEEGAADTVASPASPSLRPPGMPASG